MLIVGNDEQFRRFCEAMGVPEMASDPRFIRNGSRLQHADILNPMVAQTFAHRSLKECQRLLNEAGVPAAPINNMAQVFNDPQVIARNMVHEIKRPDGRTARMLASPIRMSRSPLRKPELPPLLGEHSDQVTDGWPN